MPLPTDALASLQRRYDGAKAEAARQTERVRVLRDENDRLRAALIRIRDSYPGHPHWSGRVADEALSDNDGG